VADGVAYVLVVPAEPIDPSDNEGVSSAQPVVETATLRALGEPGAQTGDAVVRDDLVDDEASRARMGELVLDGLLGGGDAGVEDGCHKVPPMTVVILSAG
jgi:hypothetical protein